MTSPHRLRATVTARGAERWEQGHPWIYASDVTVGPAEPGVASVHDRRGKFLGQALFSPTSEIRLRLLERGLAQPGERLVVTAGVPFDMPGTTNLLKVEAV